MPRTLPRDSAFLKEARERFKLGNDADSDQAQREKDDTGFENGDQWPADIKLARMGQQPVSGQPAVPARPTLVINKVKEPIRQILNQERASDIGIELVPADDFGDLGLTPDDTEITLREGLVRRIQRESHAADARTWAFKRAVIAGRGYYLVMTRYLPGKTSDQEIYVHRIYNQAGVVLDPAHEQPDGSDADWGFVGTWLPWDRYTAEFGTLEDGQKNPFAEYSESDFTGLTEDYPDWYEATGTGEHVRRAVRVVDYWYTERTSRELATVITTNPDGSERAEDVWVDELADDVTPAQKRRVVEKTIKYCKIGGGVQELDKTDWGGPDMPIVKVLGDEVLPYDGHRRAEGMVRPARDAQMGFNYMVSKQVEQIGLSPIPPLMLDPDAIDGFEEFYKTANSRPLLNLPYRTYNDEGKELRAPMRPPVDANVLAISQSIGLFDATIKSTTAVPDPTLGNVDPSLKSGRAIKEVVANAAQSTSNFLDNLARSIRYEGQIVNNLLYPIYGAKPGRLVRILTSEGDHQSMRVGDPQQQAQQAQQQASHVAKVATLTKDAHFNVIVKVTKSFESRRTQEATTIAELLGANPQLLTWFGDLFFKNQDGPGHIAMAERAKLMLAPPIQAMLAKQEQGQTFDPAAEAKIQQLTQQLKDAGRVIQHAQQEISTKKMENDTKLQIAQTQAGADVQKAQITRDLQLELQRMKDAAAIDVARINAETKGLVSAHEAMDEAIALDQQHVHEAIQADLDREHQQQVAAQAQAHQVAMGGAQAGQEADMAEQGQQHALEQNQQQADLAPPPQGAGA